MADTSAFPRLGREAISEELQNIWDSSEARRGEAKFIAGMAHNPGLLDWYLKDFYQNVFYGGEVERRYKELGRLRLSTVHGCRSCNKGNRIDARDGGLSETDIDNIHQLEFNGFSMADRAVMQLADLMSMAADPGSVLSHALYGELKEYFSDSDILELAMSFSILAGVARFIFAFDLAEKEDYCQF